MKYEKFRDDFNYILYKIEDYFEIEIPEKIKKKIKKKYNLKESKKHSDKSEDFSKRVDGYYMGGKHIYKGEIEGWKRIIPKKYHLITYFLLRKSLLKFGYGRNVTYQRHTIETINRNI